MPYPASYFRLNMFRQCRQRCKLHYVDGLAEEYSKARPYLTMGEHVHGALRDLFSLPVDEWSEDRLEKGDWIHDDCREPARGAGHRGPC